jgi:hypothetical protein
MRMPLCPCALILCALLPAADPPAWVRDPGALARLFPSQLFVTAVGMSGPAGTEAERLREAQDRARGELAATLRVRVRSEFTNQTTTVQTATAGDGRKFVQNLVQTQADLDLEGLDRMESWVDPRTGTVQALAVLDRARAAGLLEARLKAQAAEARGEFARARAARDLEGLLRVRTLLKRIAEGSSILRVLGGAAGFGELPTFGEVDQAARALLGSRTGLDGGLDGAVYALGSDLPGTLRVMVDRIVYGNTRFSSTFGAYLEQRLTDRLLKFDGIRILDRALAGRTGAATQVGQAQALVHGTYFETDREVSLLLKVTTLAGEELATCQVRLDRAWIDQAGLRLVPDNFTQAQQSLAILDTAVAPSELRINAQLDRGDGGIYRRDELLHLFLRADRDCYVRVVYQQVDGTRVEVFPNKYHPDGRLRGGVATRIPSPGDGFELRVTEPFGSELIHVFASTEPFDLVPAKPLALEGPFTRLDASLQALTTTFRGIKVGKAQALRAEATLVVNTVDLPRK